MEKCFWIFLKKINFHENFIFNFIFLKLVVVKKIIVISFLGYPLSIA